MGDSNWCDRCGKFIFSSLGGNCPCVPFTVYDLDNDSDCEDPHTVWSSDGPLSELSFGDVAEKFAETLDSSTAEYSIVSGSAAEFLVERKGYRMRFRVEGETVPSYRATRIEEEVSP